MNWSTWMNFDTCPGPADGHVYAMMKGMVDGDTVVVFCTNHKMLLLSFYDVPHPMMNSPDARTRNYHHHYCNDYCLQCMDFDCYLHCRGHFSSLTVEARVVYRIDQAVQIWKNNNHLVYLMNRILNDWTSIRVISNHHNDCLRRRKKTVHGKTDDDGLHHDCCNFHYCGTW